MLGFVQNWFAPRANPIGVDFGSDCLRLAQVQTIDRGELKVFAAASADVPQHVRHNTASRLQFFVETTRDLLTQGGFRGREAILALPAASMYIQHLRMAKMDDEETRKALPWEARGKLPIDPSHALMRHLIAGEIFLDSEPKNEVIVMAAARDFVEQFLAAAAKAKLDVVGMNVEPKALVDCFSHVYRRKSDAEVINCFVDIGCTGTRAVISRGQHIYFARGVPIGGDHFSRAVAEELGCSFDDAKMLRIKLSAAAPAIDAQRAKKQIHPENPAEPDDAAAAPAEDRAEMTSRVEAACREPLAKLTAELDLCRHYYEATFPDHPVERLIFVGGEARQRSLCQNIARGLSLAAQLGDPLVRMGRISDIPVESGIDRRQPQPAWAIALGLSMGPAGAAVGEPPTGLTKQEEMRA